MLLDYTRTTTSRSQEPLPLPMDDGPKMDRGLPAVLCQRDRWVLPATEKKIEEAWGPRRPRQVCQVCHIRCPSHRALRLHVDAHFLLHFCSCEFHDVFPYPVTLHKMNCFTGENHVVDKDCFPQYVDAIRPVIKKAITLAALDRGFMSLLFAARQQSPMIRSLPTVSSITTDDELNDKTPPSLEKKESLPPPGPSRLATVEERLLRLQEEFTQLALDLLSTTTGLYQLKDSAGQLKKRLRTRQ